MIQPGIFPLSPADYSRTVDVWEASVRATHDFVREEDIQLFRPLVHDALAEMDHLACIRDETGQVAGFVGVAKKKLEMLFLHPDARGQGGGKRLLTHAVTHFRATALDVNEQNEQAVGFYLHQGCEVIGRSELDGMGKPYPLLHMRLPTEIYDLDAIIQWAMARSSVRAVLLTSTRAVPHAHVDALSDYDVILILQDIRPWVDDRTWLNDFGEVLIVYWDPVYPDPDFGIEVCANVTQYVNGLKIDFTLWPVALFQRILAAPALPAELDAGYRVLLDKDHLTDILLPPTFKAYLPQPPSRAAYEIHINDFLTDAPYVAKCLWRGELFPVKWALDYDMKHIYLRQLLEWRAGVETGWTVPVGSLGKGLKRHLPPDLWVQVEETFAGATVTDNWEALAKTMALFRQVAVEVGEQLGYPYPHDVHERVCAYVDHIRQMEPTEGSHAIVRER